MKNGLVKNNTYLEFNEKDISDTRARSESSITKKDSIIDFKFYTIYEMAFLMIKIILGQILSQKKFPKIFAFLVNKDNLCSPEDYNENKKIDLQNYQQNSKHLIFYRTKNNLKSLLNKPNLIMGNSDISTEKRTEYIESLFNSYMNISFISASNFIKPIIIGQFNYEIFSENNINPDTEYNYVFKKILLKLYFDHDSCIYNDGKTIVNISLAINFPDNNRYNSYFNLYIGQYINKYLIKNYDCNKIIRDIINKYKKFVYICESKRKYIFFFSDSLIMKIKTEFEEIGNRQEIAESEEINNKQTKADSEEISNRQQIGEFEKNNNIAKIIYKSNNEKNIIEEDIDKRNIEQIQNNYPFYYEFNIVSDELSLCNENYTIKDELSP